MSHLPLDRSQAQPDPLLTLELLANHIGVAGMPAETLRHPILKPGQCSWPTATAIRYPLPNTGERSYGCTPVLRRSAARPIPTPSAAALPRPLPASASPPSAVNPPAKQAAPNRPSSNPPPQQEGPVLNVVKAPVLSVARQPSVIIAAGRSTIRILARKDVFASSATSISEPAAILPFTQTCSCFVTVPSGRRMVR